MSLNILLKWGLKLITRGFDNNNFIMILLHKVKYLYIIISAWKDKIILKFCDLKPQKVEWESSCLIIGTLE